MAVWNDNLSMNNLGLFSDIRIHVKIVKLKT